MKKRNIFITVLACVLVAALSVGLTMAYLTAKDTKQNAFTIGGFGNGPEGPGDPAIQVIEEKWQDNANNLTVGDNVDKDPLVRSYSTTQDAYVFMKVDVPTVTTDDKGATIDATDLFELEELDTTNWTKIAEKYTAPTGSAKTGVRTYIYAYAKSGACTVLPKTNSIDNPNDTPELFTSVTVKNLGLPENDTLYIDVTAYAIQTGLVDGDEAITAPADVWNLINNQYGDIGITAE